MVIKDRLLDESDKTVQYVDSKSGHIGYLDRRGVLHLQWEIILQFILFRCLMRSSYY